MAIYLGNSEKLNIILGDSGICKLYIPTQQFSIVNLLSSDNYILQDSAGVYLAAKEDK